jgi:hypothetical protein
MIHLFIIPMLLAFVPWVVVRFVLTTPQSRQLAYEQALPYLLIAATLWITAFFVPNMPISEETDTFSQHAMGGVVAGVLFLFAQLAYGWRFAEWWQSWVALFAFVSALGVVNELFELFTNTIGLTNIDSGDVWWDLLANTIGGLALFAAYKLLRPLAQPTR